jgi:hypothetical protein
MEAINAPIEGLLARMESDPETVIGELGAQNIAKLLGQVQKSAALLPTLMSSERLTVGSPTEISQHTETRNVNFTDSQRIGETLDALREAGVLDAFLSTGEIGEITDAEVVEVDDGGPDAEAIGVHDRPE